MLQTKRQKQFELFKKKERSFLQPSERQYFNDLILFFEDGENYPPLNYVGYISYQINDIVDLLNLIDEWDEVDDRILKFLIEPKIWNRNSYFNPFFNYIFKVIKHENKINNIYSIWGKLIKYKFSWADFVNELISTSYEKDTPFLLNQFIIEKVNEFPHKIKSFENHYLLKQLIIYEELNIDNVNKIENVVDKFINSIFYKRGERCIFQFSENRALAMLLRYNRDKYEYFGLELLKSKKEFYTKTTLTLVMCYFFPDKYKTLKYDVIKEFIESENENVDMYFSINSYDFNNEKKYLLSENPPFQDVSHTFVDDYFIYNPNHNWELVKNYFSKKIRISHKVLKVVIEHCGEKSYEIILSIIDSIIEKSDIDYYFDNLKSYFKLLLNFDSNLYKDKIWSFLQHKSKKIREMAAITLSKLGERIIPEASKLLNDKKGEVRQIGALILSLIKTDESQRILLEALDNEKNDDARDVILESLSGVLPAPKTEEELRERIEKAQKRGKLDSPIEKWLDESQLPSLNWLSGKAFSSDEIRYLFYRQGRTKDIRIDSEAKPMLALIDKSTSQDFAAALLKTYFTNGADAKQKYCLGLGAILGSDDECNSLKSKVTQWADAGRGKMAEYAVKALALNGSTKALRAVEFFSRKYKNKNKNIGAAANEAFVIVAEDLNISPYELADSIIPDFGFDGLFKEFEVDGEAYRAFIDNDFKLAYLNEDNKVLKSLPKATTNELKEEFKEIGKEIKDIVKSQSSRLEQYLVIQRKWNTEKWQAFFMGNPVMFAYAVRLIWGIYDADNQLIDTLRCQEDQTLINAEGDEIELPEDTQIGMVHPISLTAEQITYWTGNLYDDDIQPIFPQLTRPVITLNEKDKNLKISREFQGVQYGGYGFISKMEKTGWNRGSVVDGGWISSYFKDFSDLGFTAIITQQGELCVGYYDGNAELNELMFVRKKAVQFGSYIYDEPSNENDERLMAFGEVPAIIYSEVMADMQFFKENDLKKQNEAK